MSTATNAEVIYPRWTAGLRPILLLVGIAAAVAAGVAVVLWSRGPTYSMLYANLATEDQAQITQALDAATIPYRLEAGSNALMVPAERLSEARLKLAGQGLPDNDNGFAMMTKDAGLGVSQFVENARYQHAMETELAHTIASLRPIDGARVHLAVPRQSAFVRDQRDGSASVFVQLKAGRRLEQEQVQAIVNLVASSVPDLHSNQVTVIDQQGHLLTTPPGSDDSSLREERFQVVQRMEDDYEQRIEAIVTPIVGIGRVRAQVVAQVDSSTTEQATENYTPGSQIVRSEQQSQTSSRDASQSGGVPGALSNQPPASGVAQPPPPNKPPAAAPATPAGQAAAQATAAAVASAPTAPDNLATQSTKNYEIDRTVAYTRQPAGQLKRLTVAVVVDDMPVIGKDGKPVKGRPLTDAELTHITTLVKDAVGFDQARGDSVNVVNASFRSEPAPADAALEQVPLWETPLFRDMAKLGAGVIVLLVLSLAVLRPMIKALMPSAQTRGLLTASGDTAALSGGAPTAALAGGAQQPGFVGDAAGGGHAAAPAPAVPYEQQITNARALVNQDPKRVAQVVRNWVSVDE
ncbi:MAG TPA: flagellar basal-body MS-ring/collar protein FliF [Steroidobacteraceae bacterium]|nr:flagellar basal-body MS-ring/collar protein FliF [Steroidobacteraceae bacterium]